VRAHLSLPRVLTKGEGVKSLYREESRPGILRKAYLGGKDFFSGEEGKRSSDADGLIRQWRRRIFFKGGGGGERQIQFAEKDLS